MSGKSQGILRWMISGNPEGVMIKQKNVAYHYQVPVKAVRNGTNVSEQTVQTQIKLLL